MKYKFIITCLQLFLCIATKAQILHPSVDGQYASIGTYSGQLSNTFTVSQNQASLADIKKVGAGLFTERRFFLKELSYYQAAATIPTQYGGVGLAVNYLGYSDYNESQISIGYGKKLGEQVNLGAGFMYNTYRITGYGNDRAISFAIGTIWHVSKQINLGVHVYNPVGGKFGNTKTEKIASVYTAAIAYEIPEQFYLSAEIIKIEKQDPALQISMQYSFAKQFFARAGMNTGTNNWFLGVGVAYKNIRVDVAAKYQLQLGVTPCLMFLFQPKIKAAD